MLKKIRRRDCMNTFFNDIQAKAHVLHHGIRLSQAAKDSFNSKFLLKRRFYSNYDDYDYLNINVPQEIVFPESGIVATVILKNSSPWIVDYCNNQFFLTHEGSDNFKKQVCFLPTPLFYGKKLKNGDSVEQYITKLFGHSIGVFASTNCFFAQRDNVCKFCSISANQGRPKDACPKVNVPCILEAIKIAVSCDQTINDIFISGGVTTNNFDDNFIFYSNLAISVKNLLLSLGKTVEVTLNTYPPRNLELINRLQGTDIAVMVSIETIKDDIRSFICPGKSIMFNSIGVDNIFEKFVSAVGYGRVLAFVIQGLEDTETIMRGVQHFATLGVCIVVHVLHVDPGTWVYRQNITPPLPDEIIEIAKQVSKIYHLHKFDSSKLYGGRSSLDAESSWYDFEVYR